MAHHHKTNKRQVKPQYIAPTKDEKKEIVQTKDAFSNPLARLGYGQENILEATQYPLTRLTKNYQLMNSLYRTHWIIRKIIDTIPEDMCKNWYKVNCQVDPGMLEKLTKLERKTQVKAKILEGLKWGRLYGGAAALIMIEGHEDILDQPLDYRQIVPGSFKGLMILDRWSGITPLGDLCEDMNDPDFGLPNMYMITTESGDVFDVHHSRVIRFTGRHLPFWERQAEIYWGESEVEVIFDELKKRDNTSWNIAQLVFLANIRVLKMSDLGQLLSVADITTQQNLYNTITNQNYLMSNMGMQLLDKEDDFETHQYTFSGINDIYQSFMLDICGAAEIPMTRLFGRTITGLGQSNEGDEDIYYDSIKQKQEADLRPAIDKLLPVMCMSEWGAIPDDLDFDFNPIGNPKDKDKADLASKKTDVIVKVFDDGIIGRQTALKELRELKETTGMFSNITDEMIDQADDNVNQGEFGGFGESNLGGDNNELRPMGTQTPNRNSISKLFDGFKQKYLGKDKKPA